MRKKELMVENDGFDDLELNEKAEKVAKSENAILILKE